MKNYLHKLMALVLFFVGAQAVNAYSVADLEAAGWTKVEAISNVDDYYYVFVDAGNLEFAMAKTSNGRPVFNKLADALGVSNQVWTLEEQSGKYCIKSYDGYYFYRGSGGWNNSLSVSDKSAFTFNLSDGKYQIYDETLVGGDGNYIGPWDNTGYTWSHDKKETEYQRVVANKPIGNTNHFHLYAMLKTNYDAKKRTGEVLIQEGWTKVTDMVQLGKSGCYYTFLDASESGVVSGYAMVQTSSRPIYQGLANPLKDKKQLWYTESHGSGFAIRNADDYKYLYCIANWNMSVTENLSQANTDFIFAETETDGLWTLSNAISKSEFVGRWYNFADSPMQDEGIAANKAAGAGKRMFVIYTTPIVPSLPIDGVMEAGQWYFIDVPATTVYNVTASNIDDIVYTDNWEIVVGKGGEATSKFVAEDNALDGKRYYIMSTSSNSFSYSASLDTYTVGTATTSIAEGDYMQSLTSFVVSYPEATTTDPDAVLALLVDDAVATLKKGDEVVASGTLAVEGKALKATFAEVNLELGSAYTIEVPADVFGYEGKATNEAIVVNFYTPAVPDGVYYLRNVTAGTYLSRGKAYGTQAVMDNFGLALNVVTDKEGRTTFQYFDNKQYLGDDNPCYADTDGDRKRSYIATAVEGGYKLQNTTNHLYLAEADGVVVGDAAVDGANIVWQMETSAQHVVNYTAQVDAQAAAVAVAAGLEGIATAAALEELLAQYGTVNIPVTGASGEKYQEYASHGADGAPASYHKETIEDLEPGIYKLTVEAFQRATWNDVVAAADGARGAVYVYAGEAKTQVKSVMEYGADAAYSKDFSYAGKHYPDDASSAQVALATGNYTNVVYVYVADAGEGKGSLTIGMENPNWANNIGTWAYYTDYKLTRYTDNKVTAEEIEAFEKALAAVEKYTLGFAAGEYAPYTNVEAVKVIAAAKAIDLTTASSEPVVKATADLVALETYEWTVNEKEMNAIYDGSFEYAYSTEGNVQPIAWHGINNHDNATDVRYMWNVSANAGLTATSTGKALFTKYAAFYGTETGYTMPLKAETEYELTFIYGGWSDCKKDGYVTMTGPDETVVELSADRLPLDATDGHQNAGAWKTYTAIFTTGAAGDYVLGLRKDNEGVQSQYVYGDFKLYTVDNPDTRIQNITTDAETVIYDLAGRRVEKAVKGIYIVNGKKVIK